MKKSCFVLGVLSLVVLLTSFAHATDGYFPIGYGVIAGGMGGAATATAADAMGGANNPAGMVWAGERLDVGLFWFNPHRSATRYGTNFPTMNGTSTSETDEFFIPDFGYNHMINPNLSIGVSVYGNGGMDTHYPNGGFNFGRGNANVLGGSGSAGVDLMQLVIAPTVSWKFHPHHSVGIAPLLAYQGFRAEGLQAFSAYSRDPSCLTNRGADGSIGAGVRIGYLGRLTDSFSIGASYSTPVWMGSFTKYRGLFAQGGSFDIPQNWSVGIAARPAKNFQVALDYQRIMYSQVPAIGNPSSQILTGAMLGDPNGPGFGWKDVGAIKLGLQYEHNDQWTFRAGYAHCDNPVRSQDVTFNILAPGVVQDHFTVGASYTFSKGSTLNCSYMYACGNSVTGPSLFNNFPPVSGSAETIKMHQNEFGLSYTARW